MDSWARSSVMRLLTLNRERRGNFAGSGPTSSTTPKQDNKLVREQGSTLGSAV